MKTFGFEPPAGAAPEAWRPLEHLLQRWVLARGGSPLLAATAAWASLADGEGDAALPVAEGRHGMPPLAAGEIQALRDEELVASDADGPVRPFVLDADGYFYLWRNHAHEQAAAAAVLARRGEPAQARAAAAADLDALFQGQHDARVGAQREAVRRVPGERLFVLTGGPGTGKTTTVLKMLLMLQRQAGRALAIRIAAPTGKAAQRLVQSLRQGKKALAGTLDADWQPYLDAIPDSEALTVHRLLGYQPWRNAFGRTARDPVAAEVVVVDEASMVDLAMLRALLDAVPPDASLLLVGDADQLTSVATGSVLRDLVGALEHAGSGGLVRLEHSFRAERELVAINEAIRSGEVGALEGALAGAGARAGRHAVATPAGLRQRLDAWAAGLAALDGLRPVLSAPGAEAAAAVRRAMQALASRQLLCALRETPFGAVAVNAALEHRLRRAWGAGADAEWYPGRAVLVTRNDYASGLYNGDVGLCLTDHNGQLRVWFEVPGGDGEAGVRSFAPHTLPAHEGAFALTIHKSQGSEYGHAAVLLPPDATHRILSRQLLYTAASRARHSLELWATPAALARAVETGVQRASGLQGRILAGLQAASAAQGAAGGESGP